VRNRISQSCLLRKQKSPAWRQGSSMSGSLEL
jgi:hypothetical protein